MMPAARRLSVPAAETPTQDVPAIPEDGFGRIEHRLERLEDRVQQGVVVQTDTLEVLARIDSRQEREWEARKAMEEARQVREDRREQGRASALASLWTTIKGPLTTVLLAAAAYLAMRLTGAPSTPTPIQVAPITMAPSSEPPRAPTELAEPIPPE